MKVVSNKAKLDAKIKQIASDNIHLACRHIEAQALRNIRSQKLIDTGNLRNMMYFESVELKGRVGNGAEYAKQKEFGGPIRPRNAKALTVPVHPDAKGKTVDDFAEGELVPIKRKGRPTLLVRIISKGKSQRFDIMFVVVSQVVQPPHPFLLPAFESSKDFIKKLFKNI